MRSELVKRELSIEQGKEVDLDLALTHIQSLIADGRAEELDEARRRAEVVALYEKRSGHAEREQMFKRLRALTEAALGILSFDDPEIIQSVTRRSNWRVLGAALERGVLLSIFDDEETWSLSVDGLTNVIRRAGYTRVPPGALAGVEPTASTPWIRARQLAREQGIELTSLPPDLEFQQAQVEDRGRSMRRLYEARARLERMRRAKDLSRRAREKGPYVDAALGYLRKALQALHEAQTEFDRGSLEGRESHEELGHAFDALYTAEDCIAAALGLTFREER